MLMRWNYIEVVLLNLFLCLLLLFFKAILLFDLQPINGFLEVDFWYFFHLQMLVLIMDFTYKMDSWICSVWSEHRVCFYFGYLSGLKLVKLI